jgi:hypothetical protein
VRLFNPDGSELMRVESIERDGNRLVIRGKVFGAMPMSAHLEPQEARQGLKLLNGRLVVFLLTFLFRRARR